jgi:hypothetical protein
MKDNEKLLASGVFIILSIWLLLTAYWAAKLTVSLPDVYGVPDPLGKLYFSTTLSLIFLFVGMIARTIGASVAIFAAAGYYRRGWTQSVRRTLGAAIVLEAVYLISIIPTAWVGPDVGDTVLIPEATIPSLFEAIFVSIPLIIAAARLRWQGKAGTIARWACISGVLYIFALWIRFTGQWVATFIQTELYTTFFGGFPAHGISYVLNYPLNMFSFLLTAVGLPLLAIYLLAISWPAIRNLGAHLDTRKIGLAITLLGAYFMVAFFMLYGLPGYVGEKAIWSSFFTGHNVDLWMLGLPILGVPLMLISEDQGTKGRFKTFVILTELTGAVFAFFAFGITMLTSSVASPGGSLLSVLKAYPAFQLPLQLIGGLFIILILASLVLYTQVKQKTEL